IVCCGRVTDGEPISTMHLAKKPRKGGKGQHLLDGRRRSRETLAHCGRRFEAPLPPLAFVEVDRTLRRRAGIKRCDDIPKRRGHAPPAVLTSFDVEAEVIGWAVMNGTEPTNGRDQVSERLPFGALAPGKHRYASGGIGHAPRAQLDPCVPARKRQRPAVLRALSFHETGAAISRHAGSSRLRE